MVSIRTSLLSICLGVSCIASAWAQYDSPDLQARIQAAKDAFHPVTAADAAAARSQLEWALYDLDWSFYVSGEANRTAWKQFLQWDVIQNELAKPNPDGLALLEVVHSFKENENGLELPQFVKARKALQKYAETVLVAGDDNLKGTFAEQLERLAAAVSAFQKEHSVDNALEIAQILGWLESRQQTPDLVQHIRSKFSRPNAHFYVASHVLGKNVNRVVNEPSPVCDNILGTEIRGNACLTGMLLMKTIPCQDHARLQVELSGCVQSQTCGYQKSVTITSTGQTSVFATKVLDLNPSFLCGYPANAHCETSTTIHDISSSKLPRLIEKVAWKKAGQQKHQAEAIASDHAEARIEKRMNEESLEMIAENNARLAKWNVPLIRKDAVPEIHLATTESHLIAHATRIGVGQLGGFEAAPATSLSWDLVGQVHETAVVNFGEAYLGGMTLTDERLARIMQERTGSVPEELQISPDKDPWSITFASHAPVRARFENDQVRLAIRGQRFTRGDNRISDLIEISAAYKVVLTPTGSQLQRQGDVDVVFVNRAALGAQQVAFKTFLRRKFDALFKEQIDGTGIDLKGQMAHFGKLQMKHVVMNDGWATVGMDFVPRTAVTALKPVLPDVVEAPAAQSVAEPAAVQVAPPTAPDGETTSTDQPQVSSIPDISPFEVQSNSEQAGS